MDARDARRAAEKAARDLINTRAALIGGLGVAAARHANTTTGLTHAQHHAEALLDEARHRGAQLVHDAQSAVDDAAAACAAAYSSATGWTPAELDQLGFPAPRPAGAPAQPTSPPAPPIPACEASAATTRRQAHRQTPQRRSSSAAPPSPRATAQHRRQHCRGSFAGYQLIRAACGGTPPPTSPRSVRTRPSTGKGTPRSFPTAAREASVRTHPCPRSLYGQPGRPHGDGHSTRRPTGPGAS